MNQSDKEIIDCYSDIAPQYLAVCKDAGYTAPQIVPKRVLELLADVAKPVILDIACGPGNSSAYFLDAGLDVTGIDIAPGMLAEAAKRPFKKLICQSADDSLQVEDEAFNGVIALGALEFIRSPQNFFKQIHRKLRTGGICAATVPLKLPPESKIKIQNYSREEAMNFFDSADFELVETQSIFGFESGHFSKYDSRFTTLKERVDYLILFLRKK